MDEILKCFDHSTESSLAVPLVLYIIVFFFVQSVTNSLALESVVTGSILFDFLPCGTYGLQDSQDLCPVKPLLSGHPRNMMKCPLTRGVRLGEVSVSGGSTAVRLIIVQTELYLSFRTIPPSNAVD